MGLVRKIKAGLVKVSVNDFVGEDGNVFFDVDDGVMRLSDGTTPGGIPLSTGGDGGASTFRELLDTPSSFTDAAGNFVKVNSQGSAIEFVNVDLFDGDYNSLSNLPVLNTFDPSAIDQSLLPDTDIAYDLGSATNKWRDLYLSGNTIFLGDAVIRNVNNTVELPANARVNGRKIPLDISELDDTSGLLSGVTSYNDLSDLPVLFSGSYTDLTDKPIIPTDISDLTDTGDLLAGVSYTLPVATNTTLGGIKLGTGLSINGSGVVSVTAAGVTSYNDLTDTPTIPADISDLTDTTNLLVHFSGAYADLTGAPDLSVYQLAANAFSGSYTDLTDKPTLITSYNDLADLPILFDGAYSSLAGAPDLSVYQLAANAFSGAYADLTGLPTLVTSYNDLTDTPTIPVVPTTISAFTNDSGYITDYTVTQADVTQHQAALSITESQISDFGTYLTSETTTSLGIAGNVLTYTDETGTPTNIDLSLYLDDTNLSRITNGSIDADTGIATFTRDDASTFTIDFGAFLDDTNLTRIDSAAFDTTTGVLTLTRGADTSTVTVDLDGRFALASAIPTAVSQLTNDSGYITDYTVTQADVTQHQAALSITESQISDLQNYLTSVAFSDLTSKPTTILGYGITDAFDGNYNSLTNLPTLVTSYNDLTDTPTLFSGAYADLTGLPTIPVVPTTISAFTNDTGYITDYTVTQADVTQHQAALSITESQISDFGSYESADATILKSAAIGDTIQPYNANTVIDANYAPITITSTSVSNGTATFTKYDDTVLSDKVTTLENAGYITDYTVTQSDVTQHQTALSITESQISDFGTYLTSETTTSLAADSVNQKLVYTDETGTNNDIDLSWAVDDTNLARITSGTVDANTGIATFTRDDATTFTVDFSALFDDTNLTRITNGNVSGSTLTLTRSDATSIDVDVSTLLDNTDTIDYVNSATFNTLTGELVLSGVGDAGATVALDGRYLTSYTETNDLTSAVTWANVPDANITQSSVTQHQAALSITESQISDLQSYLTTVAFADLTSTPTTIAGYGITDAFDGNYNSLTNLPTLVTSYNDLTDTPTIPVVPTTISAFTNDSGYITDYDVTQVDVTQHQAALSITESQISDLQSYLTTVAFGDLTSTPTTLAGYGITDAATSTQGALADSAVQPSDNVSTLTNDSGYITDYTVTQADVTQHQAALSITESQISDLQSYLTSVAFSDLTSTPTTIAGYGITDAFDGAYSSLTGAPTTLAGYGIDTEVNTAISTAVNDILDGAPELLDTLNELAEAVGDDPNFVTTINSAISLKANSADLSVVATTNNYNDLDNLPDIPTDIADLNDSLKSVVPNAEVEIFAMSVMVG